MTPSAHLLRHYGLRPAGPRQIYIVRKSISDPLTGASKQLKRSTRTPDAAAALSIARPWVDTFLATAGRIKSPPRAASTTLETILGLYLTASPCATSTRRKNIAGLRKILSESLPPTTPPSLDLIDGRLARQWLQSRRLHAEATAIDTAAIETAKRGANCIYRQARSVFSRAMLATYADHGHTLPPSVHEFATQPFLDAAPPPPCEQLTPAQLSALTTELATARDSDPAAYIATLLMLLGGLRNSEAMHAQFTMLTPQDAGTWLLHLYAHGEYKPKASSRSIILSAQLVDSLRPIGPRTADDTHLIPAASRTARHTACYRSVGALLKKCAIQAIKGKVAYRLRAHAITQIILTHGMGAAQQFAGHTSPRTTAIYQGAPIPYAPLTLPST